jgi:uncharacterized protein (DUF1015 family)
MALLKPFRALRYDPGTAGSLDDLVAPPYDVVSPELRARLLAASPYNAVRLIRPEKPEDAVEALDTWREAGVLVREERPAVWLLEDSFEGLDGVARARRAVVARVRLEPYSARVVLPHERTFPAAKEARLRLLLAARTKLSPIFMIHDGPAPEIDRDRLPDLEATLGGVTSRLWRVDEPAAIGALLGAVGAPLLIADGHHRYEAALRFHEELGGEETGYALAALVSKRDDGLVIFPTHRMIEGFVPDLDGLFSVRSLAGGAAEAAGRLAQVPRDRPAFVLLRREGAVLAEGRTAGAGVLESLDTVAVDRLGLDDVTFTASAVEAERAVSSGAATAAFLVRAPTVEQIEAVALAGETMPQKSTYFFPKLVSGLLLAPFDE